MFKLPAYQELSKEQDGVFRLPLSGTHLVVGPPGTGKTVIAVYRAELYKKGGQATRFLMFNNTLNQYLSYAVELRNLGDVTSTFHKWFWEWYKHTYKTDPPQIDDFIFDWQKIHENIASKGLNGFEKFSHLVIDEGQDFPIGMYQVLPLFVDNLTIFADENQRIFEHNTTVKEIQRTLGLKKIHNLTRNYRNTRQIAEFASHFYAGLDSGIPDLPDRQGSLPRLNVGLPWDNQMRLMSTYAKNNAAKQIGIFAGTKNQVYAIYKSLGSELQGTVPLQMYVSGDRYNSSIDFSKPGIKIMCYNSAKGLEFDTVFLPLLHERRTDANIDNENMRFFVLTSRARDELIMMSEKDRPPVFMRHVPDSLYRIF